MGENTIPKFPSGKLGKVAAMQQMLQEMGIKNAVAPQPGQTYRFD